MPLNPPQSEFGQRALDTARRALKKRGWTWARLAEEIRSLGNDEFTDKMVYSKSRPGARLSLDQAVWVARALGITVDELVNPTCSQCEGAPPAGFTCNGCGRSA